VSWAAAARLHPSELANTATVHAVHRHAVENLAWGRMLRLAREDGAPAFELTAAAAARHDEGSFARWMLRCLPPEADLLAELDAVLSPAVARKIRAVVGTTAVLP